MESRIVVDVVIHSCKASSNRVCGDTVKYVRP